ncbi:MAG: shikimate dehydrogenase [Clostridiales bacterium]|nr:shikimate dehydrogenase [Clostridiales bacterium]
MPSITGHTGLYGLLGSPVAHSLSPLMHNHSFQKLGLDAVYLCFDVSENNMAQAVAGLKAVGIKGFNVTMPGKNEMARLCDSLSPAAALTQAVNTVVITDGRLTGHNTDGYGFWRTAREAGFEPQGKTVTLMGMGGAATAIAAQGALDGLKELHIYLRPTSRFHERAVHLVKELNQSTSCKAALFDHQDTSSLAKSLSASQLLINGTSVGMAPHTEQSILADPSLLHPSLLVGDVIYNPTETLLLKQAKAAGCKTFNGLYMLLYQGAEAFRLWTGQEMPVEYIRQILFSRS